MGSGEHTLIYRGELASREQLTTKLGHIKGVLLPPPPPPGPNLDLLCVWQSGAAPFCKNYTKLYFDAKHLEKGLYKGRSDF